eukprot:TRINITY_DN4715_c0_g1_i4.p2 TRINITY_DN4715_c0_g1~~TRINITY_DN4715_c0_g1_i4.p2  ORF type:complete len:262 (+),score=45.15 TRINITY_DN4715_c0_g1_i4:18-803(+)
MGSTIKADGSTSEEFEYNSGIAQGDGESPSLYCNFMEMLLQLLKQNGISYLFKLNHQTIQIHPQAWVDDLIILCHPSIAQKALFLVHQFFSEYQMNINFPKSKFITINCELNDLSIQVNNNTLSVNQVKADEYPAKQYKVATLKAKGKTADLSKAKIGLATKIHLFNTNIIPIITWGAGVVNDNRGNKFSHLATQLLSNTGLKGKGSQFLMSQGLLVNLKMDSIQERLQVKTIMESQRGMDILEAPPNQEWKFGLQGKGSQ